MSPRRSRLCASLAALACFAVTAGALCLLYRLDQHPYLVLPDVPPPAGALVQAGDGETVVVVDSDRIRAAAALEDYHQRDSSAAWWNWATQEVGPGRMIEAKALSLQAVSGTRLLIVTRSACRDAADRAVQAARAVMAAGGAVILETPGSAWTSLAGLQLAPKGETGGRITKARDLDLDRFGTPLAGLELPSRRWRVVRREPGVTPLLWIDGQPAAFLRRHGAGIAVSLAVDLGHLWQTWQQGLPDPDLQVRNRYPHRHSLPVETNDLVADRSLLTAETPVADLLEDWLFRIVAREVGLPGWWAYPSAAPGGFVMTHDEEGMGPRAAWMAEAEADWGCPSTNFIVPSPGATREALARYQKAGAAVGLHYVLPAPDGQDYPGSGAGTDGRYRMYGFWRIHPVRRLLDPAEQLAWLEAQGGNVAAVSRTHFLAWSRAYTGLFQALEQAGIRLDSSYGPDIQDQGFLFGTGRPFRPLDARGLPLSIQELPFVSAEDLGGADRGFLQRLMARSAAHAHQVTVVLFHPNAFRWHPSVSNYFTWKKLCEEAREMGLWLTTLPAVDTFARAREQASLKSAVTADTLSVSYAFADGGGTLVLPATWRGAPLLSVVQAGAGTLEYRTADVFGFSVVLVPVPAVEGSLVAQYGHPGDASAASAVPPRVRPDELRLENREPGDGRLGGR